MIYLWYAHDMHMIPHHTMPYIPYHIILHICISRAYHIHITSHHTIPYHSISYICIPYAYHIMSHQIMPYLEDNGVASKPMAELSHLRSIQPSLQAALKGPQPRSPGTGVPRPGGPKQVLDEHGGEQRPDIFALGKYENRLK